MKYISLLVVVAFFSCSDHSSAMDSDYEGESSTCGFEDGTHSATIEYYNPDTDYSNTYTLDVEVEDCQVIQIQFPNGGWLDDSHISPTDLDEDGTASIKDDRGRTWDIDID